MQRLIILITLATVFCCGSATARYVTTDSVKKDTVRKFCYTSSEVKFYQVQVQRAKQYSAENILLRQNAVDDSLEINAYKLREIEFGAQLQAKDGLIGTANEKALLYKAQRDTAIKQRNRLRIGCVAISITFVAVITYAAVK